MLKQIRTKQKKSLNILLQITGENKKFYCEIFVEKKSNLYSQLNILYKIGNI